MIPIKLSIQGLYSYQQLQEVDFRRLTESNVFGIFGKVGSGKTSLLEAISFALYGKTERLNDQDKRAYNMMNLKSKLLSIDFEFQAGPEQQLYRFVYEAKRHPKRHHEISPGERRLFTWEGTGWQPIGNEKEDVSVLSKQILGLDYDNFKRTIIIPQNQFREFLELTPVDRTKMMNQLFKLDQYDLAGRVGKLSKAADEQLAELRGLLSPLETITPETLEQAESNIDNLTHTLRTKELEIDELKPRERQLLQAQTQKQTLVNVQRELAGLLTQETTYEHLRQTISLYETCRLLFRSDLINQRKLLHKQTTLTDTQASVAKQLLSVDSRMPGLQLLYAATKKAYEGREQIQHQLDELDTVQQISTLQQSITLQSQNRRYIAARLDQYKNDVDQHRAERYKHQVFIDRLLNQPLQLERLYQVENWFAVYKPLKKQADELQTQLDEYEAVIRRLKEQKSQALTGFPAEWETLTLKLLPDRIDRQLKQLKTNRSDHEKQFRQAYVRQELVHYTDSLADGVPCPLCGSEHHPARPVSDDDKSASELIRQEVINHEQALNSVNQRIEETTSLRLVVEGLAKELRAALDNTKRLVQERAGVVQQLTEHEDLFVWTEFDKTREENLTDALRQEREQQKLLQETQRAVRELNKKIEALEAAQQEEEKKLGEFDTAIAGLNGQLKAAVESLVYYRPAEIETWNLSQITDLRDSLTRTYSQTKINFDDADKQKSEAEKLQATLQEQLQQVTNQLTDLAYDLQTINETITQNLTKQSLTGDVVERVLGSDLDIDQEKQRIKDYEHQRAGLKKQITDLEAELAKCPFDQEALTTVQNQLKTLREQKDDLHKEFGLLANVLETLKQQWAQKQTYQARFEALELRRQDLKKMDELFRAQGFVNYVSSVYLKNLCESANDRFFKLTNNQLKLELDEKNNFLVRDYLNGGDVRSVKTLSGGQTFQAALSMALALSDNIQHLTKARQNLFFLDEGFGTLDKDSLQTVFKTLKALRSENRVVGIISHVEELQQEVDTYIRTEASESGSRIIRSWEE